MVYKILVIKDRRPGHFRKAEGIASAIARKLPTAIEEVVVDPPRILPNRPLRGAAGWRGLGGLILRWVYGIRPTQLTWPDLIISAGADTLVPNVLLTRHFGSRNIFSGSIRELAPALFSLVIHTDPAFASRPGHVVLLLPSVIDPDALPRPQPFDDMQAGTIALLIGGPSASCRFSSSDWTALTSVVRESAGAGLAWRITSSRRTPDAVADAFAALAATHPDVTFLDYRTEKAGSADALFGCDAIAVTADSNTMIAEAVAARRPVIILRPAEAASPQPATKLLLERGHAVALNLAEADPAKLLAAIRSARPIDYNPLDRIASELVRSGILPNSGAG